MSTEELRAKAASLYDLTARECPWPIETAHDLREWALNIENSSEDNLTGAERRRVRDLIESLDPPEEQARKARRAKNRAKTDVDDIDTIISVADKLGAQSDQRKTFHLQGAATRKQQGARTREEIIQRYNSLTLPMRERAGRIAERLGLSPQHVRRVLKTPDQK